MGGNALKGENTYTRRYQRDEYVALEQEVFVILAKTFKRFGTPRYFESKESFGDMDVIVSMEGFNQNMHNYIMEAFEPNEIFHNGNVYSFDFKELQIDFITCAPEHYDSNYHYLAFNDLGNLIGRIAQKLGLKYGQEGLWYNHFYQGQKIGKVMISKDYPRIFEYLGLSYDRWKKGFATLEEIFNYVATSPYFDGDMFQLENLNKINRERNIKRKSYMSFLEWLEASEHRNRRFEFGEFNAKAVEDFFPESNLMMEIRRLEYLEAKKLYINSKFNGGMIMRKYGLEGKELGDAIKGFREYLGDKYDEFMLNNSQEEIFNKFEHIYNAHIKRGY